MRFLNISLIIFVLFLILGCVCANDVNDTNVQINDEGNLIKTEYGNEIISDSNNNSFSDLQKLIDENDVVTLDRNYTFAGSDSAIVINHAVTIDGNGFKIDGNKSTRLVTVTADNVVLRNITFINGYLKTGDGTGVLWSGNNGILENCKFINNSNYYSRGGAVSITGNNMSVNLCNFSYNVADTAGAIYWNGSNGTLSNSYFFKNFADGNGGAICWWGSTSGKGAVYNSTFVNNSCDKNGGAIGWYNAEGIVKNCSFMYNYAKSNGGAFCSLRGDNITINASFFYE